MTTKSINVTIDEELLAQFDEVLASGKCANRSRFIQEAIAFSITSKKAKVNYPLVHELPADLLSKMI